MDAPQRSASRAIFLLCALSCCVAPLASALTCAGPWPLHTQEAAAAPTGEQRASKGPQKPKQKPKQKPPRKTKLKKPTAKRAKPTNDSSLAAPELRDAPALTPAQVSEEWRALMSAPRLQAELKDLKATWALRDLKTGETYAAEGAEELAHPASNNKLATTAVAY